MKKLTTYTLTGLLVLLLAGAGLYLWWAWSVTMSPQPQVVTQAPAPTTTVVAQQPQPQAQQAQPAPAPKTVFEAPGKFTLAYPTDYQATTGTGLGGANLDMSFVSVSLPDGALAASGTNYVESYLTVSASTSSGALASCLTFSDVTDQAASKTGGMDINGVAFKSIETNGAAAGNSYHSQLYRTVYEGACYEVALVVHTGNVGNYDPPVSEFDQKPAFDLLQAVLQTFTFE